MAEYRPRAERRTLSLVWQHSFQAASIGGRDWCTHEGLFGSCGLPIHEHRPEIICLCGSTRFVDTWTTQYARLTDAGAIVLPCGRMPPIYELQHQQPSLKRHLDMLHLRRIDLADTVLILNVGGYVGESTQKEISYALAQRKPVRYLDNNNP